MILISSISSSVFTLRTVTVHNRTRAQIAYQPVTRRRVLDSASPCPVRLRLALREVCKGTWDSNSPTSAKLRLRLALREVCKGGGVCSGWARGFNKL
jgi:hypothetical protein